MPADTEEHNKNKSLTFWTTFKDSPDEIDFILMTQVRVIIIMLAFDCS